MWFSIVILLNQRVNHSTKTYSSQLGLKSSIKPSTRCLWGLTISCENSLLNQINWVLKNGSTCLSQSLLFQSIILNRILSTCLSQKRENMWNSSFISWNMLGSCWDQLATLAVPIPSNTAFSDTPIFIPHWLNPSSISYLNQV